MTVLSSKQVLQDEKTRDPDAIQALRLNHKALSDVSCLIDFKNLERVDLSFNNLSSLEGLKPCVNLKWLSLVQNKLQSLKGIEGLTKLSVLNAGKNKLRAIDEVKSLVSLRALIVNDNEIVSLCNLDQMKGLNTLVLSRNPIRRIGASLVKLKSMTKLSLSNCQLQTLDLSFKFCTELKELRLAHNDIKTLPANLAHCKKLRNLDLGNNTIASWSDLKVLSSLASLKILNLQGNPVAENDKLAKKIRKLLPNLQVFNTRQVDKKTENEAGDAVQRLDDSSVSIVNKEEAQKEKKKDQALRSMKSKHHLTRQINDDNHDNFGDVDMEKVVKHKMPQKGASPEENNRDDKESKVIVDKKKKLKKLKVAQGDEVNVVDNRGTVLEDPDMQKEFEHKKPKRNETKVQDSDHVGDSAITQKEQKRKSKKVKRDEANVIDDGETPFTDIFAALAKDSEDSGKRVGGEAIQDDNAIDSLVTFPVKGKKIRSRGKGPILDLSPAAEVGLGGPSTWDV